MDGNPGASAIPTSQTSSSSSSSSSSTPSAFALSNLGGSNQFLSAGLGLMIFGSFLAVSQRGIKKGASLAQRRLLISLEIPSKDKSHAWVLGWLGRQASLQNAAAAAARRQSLGSGKGKEKQQESLSVLLGLNQKAHASATKVWSHELSVETSLGEIKKQADQATESSKSSATPQQRRDKMEFNLVPGPGSHWVRYRGCWIKLHRERATKMIDLSTGAPWETLTLTTLRSTSHILPSLLSEAKQLAQESIEGKTIIYTAWGTEWKPFGKPRRVRDLSSVVLKDGQVERIQGDVKAFLNRGEWYRQRGIPYRRGYLLYGAPGSGKSSFITALAGSLDLSICLLNLSERGLTDGKLTYLLSNLPDASILLLEDIDAAFPSRTRSGGEDVGDGFVPGVTFSGLLNALDGVASSESRIVFMTTNHAERLDPALVRPGRVDLSLELGDADEHQVRLMFKKFYAESVQEENRNGRLTILQDELATAVKQETSKRRRLFGLDPTGRFATTTHGPSSPVSTPSTSSNLNPTLLPASKGGISMAELQGLFIRFPNHPEEAVKCFKHENEALREQLAAVNADPERN
ncbi:hypothetical protein IE81DRAFT_292919 [Ceraceosorus guamensis]|uniref:P-loop containing nucleoside triphosphate hydrolase protein n=1 Tax=Ceraceosorus guamensis TaxID=1522189 RepID=A0A316VZ27_9BASI|nr:hypothetical protein IE81DRAFT_292919 [Ceraceosorus guamensis]PWN40735.1 hypothetical protein IE81DRAFT_292919 [Ceraceosorus guamensis]